MVEKEAGSPTVNIGTSGGVIGFHEATPVAKQTITTLSMLSLQTALINLGLVKI